MDGTYVHKDGYGYEYGVLKPVSHYVYYNPQAWSDGGLISISRFFQPKKVPCGWTMRFEDARTLAALAARTTAP